MTISYTILRTQRKTIQIRVDAHGDVTIRAPLHAPRAEIERFVQQKADWIATNITAQKARDAQRYITDSDEINALRLRAKTEVTALTACWARRMGVSCTGVKITSAARRWGSCSARDSICYSWRVMLLPPAQREYIVVHELAHIRVKNHSPAFYAEVARWLPDYRQRIAALHAFEHAHPM